MLFQKGKYFQFSKSNESIRNLKSDFIIKNKILLQETMKINSKYKKQKKRVHCKNCQKKLNKYDFISFGIKYCICKRCSHINGAHEDSDNFINFLYREKKGKNYSENYMKFYKERVIKIYLPKIKFIEKTLFKNKKRSLNILDFGCGAGHFLKACEIRKHFGIGYDTNETLVDLSKKKLKKNICHLTELDSFPEIIKNSSFDVISLIGVLEHLQNPNELLRSFKQSKSKYLFLSLPLFSLSSLVENSNQNLFPRHLSRGHTHLYTENSINNFIKRFKLRIVGEWWFGSDISDLYRTLFLRSKFRDLKIKEEIYKDYFSKVMDKLQTVLDRDKICSEVHLLISKT